MTIKQGRTPPGVRELKLYRHPDIKRIVGRTPPGVRELKLLKEEPLPKKLKSHPSWGA